MQFRELMRHFFNGFFDVEIIHPEAESKLGLGHILAGLAVPGCAMGASLLFRRWDPPPLWLNQAFYLFYGMSMIGFVTVFQWDALFLGRRDWVVLGALPIRTRTILAAKVGALLQYLGLFVLTVSGPPTVLLPLGFATSREPLLTGLMTWFGQALAAVLGSAFAFFGLIAVQGTVMNVLPAGLFRRITPVVQVGALCLTLVALFAYPKGISLLKAHDPWLWYLPQFWFLGLAQTIGGQPEPVWRELAGMALKGMGTILVWAAAVYLLSYYRHAKRSLEQASEVAGTPSLFQRGISWLVNRLMLRSPTESAVFWFTIKTALRSRRHWLILGGYAGVGLAFVLDALLAGLVRSGSYAIFLKPSPRLFLVPLTLTFVILSGLRFIFTIPAELRANWVFRMSESADRHVYHRAVRKAMFLLMTLPVLLPVFAVEAILWGTDLAGAHALLNALLSWVLVEASLASFHKIPFTCSYLPGKANLPYSAGLYFAIFATYSTAMSQIGYRALTGPRWQPLIWLAVVLAALAFGFRWHRRQRPESSGPIVFDDEPEGLVTLRLLQ
jgi:hypothetical protein